MSLRLCLFSFLGERIVDLKTARRIRGLTQLEIERQTGIFQSKISREESGLRILNIDERRRLEAFLDLPINWNSKQINWNSKQDEDLTTEQIKTISTAIHILRLKAETALLRRLGKLKCNRDMYTMAKNILDRLEL